jgi:hypothetical protein
MKSREEQAEAEAEKKWRDEINVVHKRSGKNNDKTVSAQAGSQGLWLAI